MDCKCRNDSRLKIVCPKIQYCAYQKYWMCTACTLYSILLSDKVVTSLSMVPNCHHYHCQYIWNCCIALWSRCSDSNIQQKRLARKEIAVIVLIWLKRNFGRVSPKRIGEIVNFCRNNRTIEVFILKGDMFMRFFFKENVFEVCL